MKDDSLSDVYKPRLIYADASPQCITSEGVVLDSVGKQENCFSPNEVTNVYAKQIWNDAIEAACNSAKTWMNKEYTNCDLYVEIRKLKK